MRVLVLSNYYPPHSIGSYELQCYQLCHELAGRGHRIHVLTSQAPPEYASRLTDVHVSRELELYEDEQSFHRLFKKVRYNRKVLARHLSEFIPEAIMIWGMDGLPASLLEVAEWSGIPCVYAVYDHWLRESCFKDRWSNYWSEETTAPPIARTLLRSLHLEKTVQRKAALGKVEALRFENIYFCSESLKRETAQACGHTFEQALVIPCAVPPGQSRQKEGRPAQTCRLLYIARFSEEKDPMTALRALQELRRRGDDRFTLDLYGKGRPEFEGTLHDYVRRFQLGGSVSFKPMAEEQVRTNLHLYDALIFTSKYAEPFPLIHLRAMEAGVPVISTLNGGSGELIRHGENGLAFEAGNQFELADRIAQLADDPALAERLVETARTEVARHYTLARIGSRVETLLHRAARTEGRLEVPFTRAQGVA